MLGEGHYLDLRGVKVDIASMPLYIVGPKLICCFNRRIRPLLTGRDAADSAQVGSSGEAVALKLISNVDESVKIIVE